MIKLGQVVIAPRRLAVSPRCWGLRTGGIATQTTFATDQEVHLPEVAGDDGTARKGVLWEDELERRRHVLPGEQSIGELRALQACPVAGGQAGSAWTRARQIWPSAVDVEERATVEVSRVPRGRSRRKDPRVPCGACVWRRPTQRP